MPFTALIVDDEPLARQGLRLLLSGDSEFHAIHEAKNGLEAVTAIRTAHPDLVFLDVQMPEMDGMSVVREIGAEQMPSVVFVTAHDQYAIQAFEINAVDYLLKPVTAARFAQTLERSKLRLHGDPTNEAGSRILAMLETLTSPNRYAKRLAVRSAGRTVFIEVQDIDWMKAAENYVQLHGARETHLLHITMNTLEKSLDPEQFLRVHRSVIINLQRIKELQPATHGEYLITLHNGTRLQSGRIYSARLRGLASF